MICYRDKTFCTFYTDCAKGSTCNAALTPQVENEAKQWWGGEGYPICVHGEQPECYERK